MAQYVNKSTKEGSHLSAILVFGFKHGYKGKKCEYTILHKEVFFIVLNVL